MRARSKSSPAISAITASSADVSGAGTSRNVPTSSSRVSAARSGVSGWANGWLRRESVTHSSVLTKVNMLSELCAERHDARQTGLIEVVRLALPHQLLATDRPVEVLSPQQFTEHLVRTLGAARGYP